MASPIRPSDIKDTLPTTDGSACARLKKVIVDFPRRVYEWFSYIYNEDGTFTEDFKTDFCAIKCDDIQVQDTNPNDDDTTPSGGMTPPLVRAGAAMRHEGGIPVVFQEVPYATKYDIYRGTTNAKDANTTIRLRKDLQPRRGKITDDLNKHLSIRPDGSIMYLDVQGGLKYKPNVGDEKTNAVAGGTPYYYWVVAKNDSGSRSAYSSSAQNIGFSRYVTNYTAIGSPKLLWSGQSETPSGLNAKTRLRLLLRGGGGGGGGGGDWTLPTWTKYYIKHMAYNSSNEEVTLTFYQEGSDVTDFNANDEITLEGTGLPSWNKGGYKVDRVMNQADEIVLKPIGSSLGNTFDLGDLLSDENGGKVPGTTNIAYYGRAYATKHKLPQRIPGGGGGGGGMLQAVFELTAITDVRVRTLDWNDVEVNYEPNPTEIGAGTYDHLNSLDTDNFMGDDSGDGFYPFNEGGMGRQTTGGDPAKAGEPKSTAGHHGQPAANDNNTSNTGPYKTVFEVKKGSTWYLVAWVSEGEGGGHADTGPLTRDSTGGKGAPPILFKASDTAAGLGDKFGTTSNNAFTPYAAASSTVQAVRYGIISHSGVCELRDEALGGKGSKFFAPSDGSGGVMSKAHNRAGEKGWAGAAWDSVQPGGTTWPGTGRNPGMKHLSRNRGSNGFDLQAPGSGGNCSDGCDDESYGPEAWGGHALAGCAYLTYATTSGSGTELAKGGYDDA